MSEHLPESFADDYLPVYDISDAVAVVVETEPQRVWEALLDADLLEVGRRSLRQRRSPPMSSACWCSALSGGVATPRV